MGKIKAVVFSVLFLLVSALTACGSQAETAEDNSQAVVQENEEKEVKSQGEIPQELLPGQGENEEGSDDSDTMEIVGSDGTVYASESKSAGSGGADAGMTNSGGSGAGNSVSEKKGIIQIDFSIESSKADGSVSYAASMTLDEGSSVYDALQASGVSHNGKSYVSSIGGLSEGMFGAQSGWKYYVNGSAPNTSCVNYTLKDGDRVQWSYVLKP